MDRFAKTGIALLINVISVQNLTACRSDNTTCNLLKNDFHCLICIVSAWDELDQRVIYTAVKSDELILTLASWSKMATLNTICPKISPN